MPSSGDGALVSLRLPSRPEAASAARKALASLNGDLHLVSEARLRDAQLLLTELVANAVSYGDPDSVTVKVTASETTLHVDVGNRGGAFDPAALAGPSLERGGGWGLRIVDVVAHRWGTESADGGVHVWFEVDRPRAEHPVQLDDDAPPPGYLAP
jgi:anti-sigma regulatory factor (Ser/Thr protein kinase)